MTIEENTNGLGNRQTYNQRTVDEARFSSKTRDDSHLEVEIAFNGDDFTIVTGTLPNGFKIVQALVNVTEVFVVGGTTPNIAIGTSGSEETNGLLISEAILEALGKADVTATLTGTWAALLAADTLVNVVLEGDTTLTAAGRLTIKIIGEIA